MEKDKVFGESGDTDSPKASPAFGQELSKMVRNFLFVGISRQTKNDFSVTSVPLR